jgi:hypothetical protein
MEPSCLGSGLPRPRHARRVGVQLPMSVPRVYIQWGHLPVVLGRRVCAMLDKDASDFHMSVRRVSRHHMQ